VCEDDDHGSRVSKVSGSEGILSEMATQVAACHQMMVLAASR
jgi:hypothetical protein